MESEANIERDLVFDILAQKKELQLDFVAAENKETFYIDTLDGFDPKFFASKATLDNLLTAKNLRTNPTSMMVRTTPNQAEKVADTLTKQYGDYIDVRTWGGPMPILEMVAKGIQRPMALIKWRTFYLSNQLISLLLAMNIMTKKC